MAVRGIFVSKDTYPFFEEIHVSFDYFQGFALSQKCKSQISLHNNFLAAYPEQTVLEVSSSSLYFLGASLSAMNLRKGTKTGLTTVESAFQSSRIYGEHSEIGPFPQYLFLPGRECKRLVKEQSNGLRSYQYRFDGMNFYAPVHYISLFYNYLYLNALCEDENKPVAEGLLSQGYTAFSDLATRSLNTQARAAAIFVALVRNCLNDKVKDYDTYLELFRTTRDGRPINSSTYRDVQLIDEKGRVHLLSTVVPCTFSKAEAINYYTQHCSGITNKKDPTNYLDKIDL